jgi:hypothetical protein
MTHTFRAEARNRWSADGICTGRKELHICSLHNSTAFITGNSLIFTVATPALPMQA